MAIELINDWEKLKLTEDEEIAIGNNLGDQEENDIELKILLSSVAKLLTSKPFNVEAMQKTIQPIWRISEKISVRTVDTNLLCFNSIIVYANFVLNT